MVFRALKRRKRKEKRKSATGSRTVAEEIIKVFNRPPPSHGHGFSCGPSRLCRGELQKEYYFHGGCSWKEDETSDDFSSLYVYHPTLHSFRRIDKNLPAPIVSTQELRISPNKRSKNVMVAATRIPNINKLPFRYRHSMVYVKKKSRKVLYLYGGIAIETTFRNELVEVNLSNPEGAVSRRVRYSLPSGKYREVEILQTPIAFHHALYQKHSDRMYVYGGKSPSVRLGDVRICDFKMGCWRVPFIYEDDKCFFPKSPQLKRSSKLASPTTSWKTKKRRKKKKVYPTNPGARTGFSMHWMDDSETMFFIFGGCCRDLRDHNDAWTFDTRIDKWKYFKTGGDLPCPRASHASEFVCNKLVVFGGANDKEQFNDLYILSLKTRMWKEVDIMSSSPLPRMYIHKIGISVEGYYEKVKLFCFGGMDQTKSINSLYEIDITSEVSSVGKVDFFRKRLLNSTKMKSFCDCVVECQL